MSHEQQIDATGEARHDVLGNRPPPIVRHRAADHVDAERHLRRLEDVAHIVELPDGDALIDAGRLNLGQRLSHLVFVQLLDGVGIGRSPRAADVEGAACRCQSTIQQDAVELTEHGEALVVEGYGRRMIRQQLGEVGELHPEACSDSESRPVFHRARALKVRAQKLAFATAGYL